MIVKSQDADRFAAKPPASLKAALVFGPDQGLVHERAEKIARTVVDDLKDPFRVVDFEESVLNADGARLFDEAAAISMMGGRRVIRIRSGGNTLAKLFESFLDEPIGDALIVVEGGDLAKNSTLRKVFEESNDAAAIQCYGDSEQSLSGVVRDALKAQGLSISAEALDDAVSRLGSDRGVTRREIEKLALYAHGQKNVSLEDVRATLGDESEVRVEEVLDATGEGDLKRLDLALERVWADDMNAIAVVRSALGHFQKLLSAKAATDRGESIDGAMRKMWPPIHFSRTSSFKAQATRWNEDKLGEALDLLLETEALCKTTAVPGEAVLGRALFNIAAMARAR
ncbi:MAG TPA: DNA polymerase III subunit delta [Rhizomicrobium sp.]|jgi:DNA polymerase-3 subunit delta|nr:DNA polymerase III subunit delta [Rhizomicrobium sp.]